MPRRLSEEATRIQMIDPQLEKARWYLRDHSRVNAEIPVDGYDAEPWNGVPDYTLYRENREVLARKIITNSKQQNYNTDQNRFLRAEQSVFLQRHYFGTVDLYEPPLDMFGADAVERWFTELEVSDILYLIGILQVLGA